MTAFLCSEGFGLFENTAMLEENISIPFYKQF